jgi:hypothetical protein
MSWKIIFDFRDAPIGLVAFPLFGVVMMAVAALQLRFSRRLRDEFKPRRALTRRVFARVAVVFFAIWTLGAGFACWSQYSRLSDALRRRAYVSTEGTVSQIFDREKSGGFSVGTARFEFLRYVVTGGYKGRVSRGAPLQDGQRVRVDAVGGDIARIWRLE